MEADIEALPELLALDWGTSSMRAFLMRAGQVLETRQSDHGIQHLPIPGTPGYERALTELVGDWVSKWPRLPVVASGMVGSAQGWKEAPYVRCPANVQALAEHGAGVASGMGAEVMIAPGVLFDEPDALPDVMRGEEIQIAGALQINPQWAQHSCVILPGTHSKWALVEDGKIVRFKTFLTGEMFSVLCRHSILGRLMPEDSDQAVGQDQAAFELGLSTARESGGDGLTHQVFATRTLGLTGRLAPKSLKDYLSGLLIGHEVCSGLTAFGHSPSLPLVVIGAPELGARYTQSLAKMGVKPDAVLENTAPLGLWSFAREAGLLAPH